MVAMVEDLVNVKRDALVIGDKIAEAESVLLFMPFVIRRVSVSVGVDMYHFRDNEVG